MLTDDTNPDAGMRPETADFLNDLPGIGTGAYLDMRQADTPEFGDWRDTNFTPDDSGNYVSQAGQAYTNSELQQIHGVLSEQAGNPLVSGLFDGPKSPLADYMTWRNQNYYNHTGGAWEDEDGILYTEPALQEMFAAKSAAQPGERDDLDQDASAVSEGQQQGANPTQADDEEGPDEDSEAGDLAQTGEEGQSDANPGAGQQQEPDLLAQNQAGPPTSVRPRQQQQPRQPVGQQQPQQRDRLTQAERDEVARVAYSETTRGTVAEHEAIASVILNRAQSGDRRYVNRGQQVNVHNVIHAAPGGARQFQGVGGNNEQNFPAIHDQGSQNARTAAANVAHNGPTNRATAFIATAGREPTAREERNLGNVHRTGRVGNVFLYEPGPAPETPVLPRRVQPQRPRTQSPISSPWNGQQLPDNEE